MRVIQSLKGSLTFPITRCDKAVERVGDAKYYITADLDAGYWQVTTGKTAFFIANEKKYFSFMLMGATNAHAAFVVMVSNMEIQLDKLYYELMCKKREEAEWK